MRDGNSAERLLYEDMMAGVDHVMKLGVANPSQLGVYGHSYGGYLTAYTITQTDRFRAAAVHESGMFEWLTLAMRSAPSTDCELLMRDPLDPAETMRLLAESPGFNMSRVSTPTLLHFGAHSHVAESTGWLIFGALTRRQIPAEFVIYDEGHVNTRPAAIADDLVRMATWFGYWLRGDPYPDADRARVYDQWKLTHEPRRTMP